MAATLLAGCGSGAASSSAAPAADSTSTDASSTAAEPAAAEKVLAITREIVSREKLTTLMITHNIQSALSMGTRTIMMNAGRIVLDIAGEERAHMTVPRLLELYQQKSGAALDTDRILLTQTQ